MKTRQQLAREIIQFFEENRDKLCIGAKENTHLPLENYIYASSSLGICLELLNQIEDETAKNYIANRCGMFPSYYKHLIPEGLAEECDSLREIFSMLPDETNLTK